MEFLHEYTPKLADRLAKRLIDAIQQGLLPAESRLPTEQALGEQYGVSRTVVREAISMLKREGLVASHQGRGTYVTAAPSVALRLPSPQGNPASVREILEIRSALEVKAATLAAVRRTDTHLRAMRNALEELDDAVRRGENGVREDLAFHRSVVLATGNDHFVATLDFLHQLLFHAIGVTRSNEARFPEYMQQVDDEHRALFDAVAAGDAEAAQRAAKLHLDNAERRLKEGAGHS
jgi:DNA-binding FadR family transcriptional regulator